MSFTGGANTLMVAGIDTTKTYTPTSGAGTVTDVSNLPYTLGTVVARKGSDGQMRRYKFVLVEDAALVSGQLVCYTTDDNDYEVTNDRSGGTSDNNKPAGLAVQAIADGSCGWIQTAGLNDVAITTDGSVAADEPLIAHATTDGGADSGANTDNPNIFFGYAQDADTGTSLAAGLVMLDCPGG